MSENVGKVLQVIGPVLDIEFDSDHVPHIYNAIHVTSEGFDSDVEIDLTAEVAQHLGEGVVKCICMQPTDGMVRGMKAVGPGPAHHGARGPGDAGPGAQRSGRAGRPDGRSGGQGAISNSSSSSQPRVPKHRDRDVRDRHQGDRPHRAVLKGRQDRPLRRRRGGQDRHHHGV